MPFPIMQCSLSHLALRARGCAVIPGATVPLCQPFSFLLAHKFYLWLALQTYCKGSVVFSDMFSYIPLLVQTFLFIGICATLASKILLYFHIIINSSVYNSFIMFFRCVRVCVCMCVFLENIIIFLIRRPQWRGACLGGSVG